MATKNAKVKSKNLVAVKNEKAPAGRPMKGRDILVKALENEGVDAIFGYPGALPWKFTRG